MKVRRLDSCRIPHAKNVSKTKYKRLTVIGLEEKMGESVNLHDNGFAYGFVYITPKVQEKRKKEGRWTLIKFKNFYSSNKIIKESKNVTHDGCIFLQITYLVKVYIYYIKNHYNPIIKRNEDEKLAQKL